MIFRVSRRRRTCVGAAFGQQLDDPLVLFGLRLGHRAPHLQTFRRCQARCAPHRRERRPIFDRRVCVRARSRRTQASEFMRTAQMSGVAPAGAMKSSDSVDVVRVCPVGQVLVHPSPRRARGSRRRARRQRRRSRAQEPPRCAFVRRSRRRGGGGGGGGQEPSAAFPLDRPPRLPLPRLRHPQDKMARRSKAPTRPAAPARGVRPPRGARAAAESGAIAPARPDL